MLEFAKFGPVETDAFLMQAEMQPCAFFWKTGFCANGGSCPFAHEARQRGGARGTVPGVQDAGGLPKVSGSVEDSSGSFV